jgi:hypothetical protein
MLEEIMNYCNNFFKRSESEGLTCSFDSGTKTITFTADLVDKIIPNMYIKVFGTLLNDGVYKVTGVTTNTITVEEVLVDESDAEITLSGLAPTKDFLSIVTKIETDVTNGTYNNVERIKRGDTEIKYSDNALNSWQEDYKSSLFPFKKVRAI